MTLDREVGDGGDRCRDRQQGGGVEHEKADAGADGECGKADTDVSPTEKMLIERLSPRTMSRA